MKRELTIEVDYTTWPAPPDLPLFPTSFHKGSQSVDIDIPSMLLLVGLLTTPSITFGVSMSEYWAWVRYVHALTSDSDLRLTTAFATLDAHQKTILSDDLGMGLPMLWLIQKLQLRLPCDGRYFIERVSASIGAVAAKTAKRGPNKAPDFVAQDAVGVWHVIECKGTQSGTRYRDRQMGSIGPPSTGALAQKQAISFPVGHLGQRLACGLSLAIESSDDQSHLMISDPDHEEKFVIREQDLPLAEDAILRAATAKALRLAGFEATASLIAAPAGIAPGSGPGVGRSERTRQHIIEAKRAEAQKELDARRPRTIKEEGGENYRGRELILDLARPIYDSTTEFRRVRITQGVNSSILDQLQASPLADEPLIEIDNSWREYIGPIKMLPGEQGARLTMGNAFFAEIEFT